MEGPLILGLIPPANQAQDSVFVGLGLEGPNVQKITFRALLRSWVCPPISVTYGSLVQLRLQEPWFFSCVPGPGVQGVPAH